MDGCASCTASARRPSSACSTLFGAHRGKKQRVPLAVAAARSRAAACLPEIEPGGARGAHCRQPAPPARNGRRHRPAGRQQSRLERHAPLRCLPRVSRSARAGRKARQRRARQADCRSTCASCRRKAYGAALLYFTGSKAYNIELRKRAIARGLKLNEYGLFKGTRRIAGATEESIYEALDLPWTAPERREVGGLSHRGG